jgi:hypothetical protein
VRGLLNTTLVRFMTAPPLEVGAGRCDPPLPDGPSPRRSEPGLHFGPQSCAVMKT